LGYTTEKKLKLHRYTIGENMAKSFSGSIVLTYTVDNYNLTLMHDNCFTIA